MSWILTHRIIWFGSLEQLAPKLCPLEISMCRIFICRFCSMCLEGVSASNTQKKWCWKLPKGSKRNLSLDTISGSKEFAWQLLSGQNSDSQYLPQLGLSLKKIFMKIIWSWETDDLNYSARWTQTGAFYVGLLDGLLGVAGGCWDDYEHS